MLSAFSIPDTCCTNCSIFNASGKNPTEILSFKVCFKKTLALCDGNIKTTFSNDFVVFKMESKVSEIKDCIEFFGIQLGFLNYKNLLL